jgi:hypothetical protein
MTYGDCSRALQFSIEKESASNCVEALFRATVAQKKAEGEVQLANGRTQNIRQRSDAESRSEKGHAHARTSPWILARVSS